MAVASAWTNRQAAWNAARVWTRGASLVAAGALLDAVSAGARRLPATSRYAVSDAVIAALGPTLRRTYRTAEANFAELIGSTGGPGAGETGAAGRTARDLARRSVRNYGRMAMDFLASRTMSDDEILSLVDRRGEADFREAMTHGRGVIFALPHAGCWDVAAVFAQAYGARLTVVTESNWVTELVAGSRRSRGVTLAPRDQSLRSLFRALRRQECVVMLSDIAPPDTQSDYFDFFGAPARFPLGPARLAHATGAPIMVIGSVRMPDNRFLVEAQPPIMPERTCDAEEDVRAMTEAVVAGFERIITTYPDQWYPYHPVWEPGVTIPATHQQTRSQAGS